MKLDWLNENEVNFFLKCNTEHKKYEKIQKLAIELEDKKVKSTLETGSFSVHRGLATTQSFV